MSGNVEQVTTCAGEEPLSWEYWSRSPAFFLSLKKKKTKKNKKTKKQALFAPKQVSAAIYRLGFNM